MENLISIREELLIKIVEAGLAGRKQDVSVLARILSSEIEARSPAIAKQLATVASIKPTRQHEVINPHSLANNKRVENMPHMLIEGTTISSLEIEPTFEAELEVELQEIVDEHLSNAKLQAKGLTPVKTVLFDGPPGVGKTFSARWIANSLNLPLYVLDLAAVMNSHLGKTGNNIKEVFNFISNNRCVLLLDEFDAIAKKRDDSSDIGELKRLVTVLLQALDNQSDSSLIIAATNHSELLDPAVWRRFEKKVVFKMPSSIVIREYLSSLVPDTQIDEFSFLFDGMDFSDILYRINRIKKLSILNNSSLTTELLNTISSDSKFNDLDLSSKKKFAMTLVKSGISQREVSRVLRLSRPTISKYINENMDV